MLHLNHSLHTHTYLSDCCPDKEHQRPAILLKIAEEMRLDALGFSDHIWANQALRPSAWYGKQDGWQQIARLRQDLVGVQSPVRALIGCEGDMFAPGKIGLTPDFVAQLDYSMISCNHFQMKEFIEQPRSLAPRDLADHLFKFFLSAVTSGLATIISHPLITNPYPQLYDTTFALISDQEFLDVLGVAAERKVALELPSGFVPDGKIKCWSLETPIRFYSLARQAGCQFVFGTDAHRPEELRRLPQAAKIAEPAGITDSDILPLVRHKE